MKLLELEVAVFNRKDLKSWPKHSEVVSGEVMTLGEALQRRFSHEAYITQYAPAYISEVEGCPRLHSTALDHGVYPQIQLVIFDLDTPGHNPRTLEWEESLEPALERMIDAWGEPVALYGTFGGIRIVYALASPRKIFIKTRNDAKVWKANYLRWSSRLMDFGFGDLAKVDELVDWTRFQGLPHVTRDGKMNEPNLYISDDPGALLYDFDILPVGETASAVAVNVKDAPLPAHRVEEITDCVRLLLSAELIDPNARTDSTFSVVGFALRHAAAHAQEIFDAAAEQLEENGMDEPADYVRRKQDEWLAKLETNELPGWRKLTEHYPELDELGGELRGYVQDVFAYYAPLPEGATEDDLMGDIDLRPSNNEGTGKTIEVVGDPGTELEDTTAFARYVEGEYMCIRGKGDRIEEFTWNGNYWMEAEPAYIVRKSHEFAKAKAEVLAEEQRQLEARIKELQTVAEIDGEAKQKACELRVKRIRTLRDKVYSVGWQRNRIGEAQKLLSIKAETLNAAGVELLPVANGTIDLRTGELLPPNRDDKFTNVVPHAYNPDAKAPRWLRFLDEITQGDKDLQGYLQRVVGFAATGHTSPHSIFVLEGAGQNGKSTFTDTLLRTFAGFSYAGTPEYLTVSRGRSSSNPAEALLHLHGRRAVFYDETSDGASWNAEVLKRVTGGGELEAKRLYFDPFNFTPTHTLMLVTNNLPTVAGASEQSAVFRRMRVIPFRAKIKNVDTTIGQKLEAEAEGILAWAVEGAVEFLRRKNSEDEAERADPLGTPEVVWKHTSAYKSEQDVFGEFLDLHYEVCPDREDVWVEIGEFNFHYQTYCDSEGVPPFSAQQRGRRLEALGCVKKPKGPERKRSYVHLRRRESHLRDVSDVQCA